MLGKKTASQEALVVKNPPASAGDERDVGWITGLGRSPGGGNGNPLQSSPGESHGEGSLVGCGPQRRRVGRDRSDLAHTA